jgi:hypothetical protein
MQRSAGRGRRAIRQRYDAAREAFKRAAVVVG